MVSCSIYSTRKFLQIFRKIEKNTFFHCSCITLLSKDFFRIFIILNWFFSILSAIFYRINTRLIPMIENIFLAYYKKNNQPPLFGECNFFYYVKEYFLTLEKFSRESDENPSRKSLKTDPGK